MTIHNPEFGMSPSGEYSYFYVRNGKPTAATTMPGFDKAWYEDQVRQAIDDPYWHLSFVDDNLMLMTKKMDGTLLVIVRRQR